MRCQRDVVAQFYTKLGGIDPISDRNSIFMLVDRVKNNHETSIFKPEIAQTDYSGPSSGMAEVRILPYLSRNRIKPKAGFYDAVNDLRSSC
jgi:hypothetical protein